MFDDALSRAATRQTLTATTFVDIVATLVGEFDVVDVLTAMTSHSVELLDAAAAGILLVDLDGRLRVIGASTEAIELLELFQIQGNEGPSLDCFRSGKVVLHSDSDIVTMWPLFGAECTKAGFSSVCAVPMRLKSHIIGCLNMFMADSRGLTDIDVGLAQALADVATIAIIQDQVTRDSAIREGHLQNALTSRIPIEQAKGMVAKGAHVNMDDAFARVRAHARDNNRSLTSVAEALVSGALAVEALAQCRLPPPRPRLH
jgi:transcriptional regulator with GAF, ATPase, and Fis domain